MDSENSILAFIYKCFPLLKYAEKTAPILERMGLSVINLREIYETGSTSIIVKIIDPDTGKEHRYVENLMIIRIEIRGENENVDIYINGVQYKEFFRLLEEQESYAYSNLKAPDPKKDFYFSEYLLLDRAIEECDPEMHQRLDAIITSRIKENSEKKK